MAASSVDHALKKVLPVFGVESLKNDQKKILDCILSGKDCMAVLPTGYGKSLPFQLYPLLKNELDNIGNKSPEMTPKVIVCSPLIALMKDQVKKLSAIPGFRAGYKGQSVEIDADIRSGMVDLIYASPETLVGEQEWRAAFQKLNEKYLEYKKRDAERKKEERQTQKKEVLAHPRKYKERTEREKLMNAERVRKHRNKTCNETPKPSAQKMRRLKEKKQKETAESRQKEKIRREANRKRVNNYRLRVKLSKTSPVQSQVQNTTPKSSGYLHKSSESRALKRVRQVMPNTPAKKARLLEKLITRTTPRSRSILSNNRAVQSVIISKQLKRNLSAEFNIIDAIIEKVHAGKKKSVTSIIASKLLTKSRKLSAAAKLIGINRFKLTRSLTSSGTRKRRSDRVSDESVTCIQNFYLEDASREMPNKRDVLLLRNSDGSKQPVQKHIMEMSQHEAYMKFKENNPSMKISKRKFDSLRPLQVRRINTSNRIVCCCTYCENIRLKVQSLNAFFKDKPFQSVSDITNRTLCEKSEQYHKKKCIERACEDCGPSKLQEIYSSEIEEFRDQEIMWREWKLQTVPLTFEKNVTRVMNISQCDKFSSFMEKLCVALHPHAGHLFRASWQYEQFRKNVNSIEDGDLVMAMDFSENYTCRHGREIQSFHWNQKQITLHPMMLYYKKNGELQRDGFIPITDDLKHDAWAVAHFEKMAVEHVRERGVRVDHIHQWTDGCASQYKGKHSFAKISMSDKEMGASVTRNYFETSHGKGPCDGLGGIVKRKVSTAILQNNNLSIANARDLYDFCVNNLQDVGTSSHKCRESRYAASSRTFKIVENIDRSVLSNVQTLLGSRKLHSVGSTGNDMSLKVRQLSCYCEGCRRKTMCENTEYVEEWESKILRSSTPQEENPNASVPARQPENHTTINSNHRDVKVNDFVAVKFENRTSKQCFFAKVNEKDGDEICVEYMEKIGKDYRFSVSPEESFQSVSDIVCILDTPESVICGTRVKCVFKLSEIQKDLLSGYKLI